MRWADCRLEAGRRLYPPGPDGAEAARIEAWLDGGLGPDARLWMYESTLPMLDEMLEWVVPGTPRWEQAALRSGTAIARRFMDLTMKRKSREETG